VSRRVFAFAFAVGLLAAACSTPPATEVSFGSGERFVPSVADFLDDVGVDPTVAVVPDGTAYVAYFGFLERLAEGEIAPVRPIGAPSLPSVMLASVSGGLWTRGAVAMETAIPNVDVAFGPAEVKDVKDLTADNVTGTDMVADGDGKLHVVWSSTDGLWYATNTGGSFQAQRVTPAPASGPSIAVDGSGTPWVAYLQGGDVVVSVLRTGTKGSAWTSQGVAPAPACRGCRTAIGITGEAAPIVAFSDGKSPMVARHPARPLGKGEEWKVEAVGTGSGGQGMDLAVDTDGNPHVSYYAGTEVIEARSIGGAPWQTSTVATVGEGTAGAAGAATSIAVDDQGVAYVAWYDAGDDSVALASNDTGTFAPIETSGTRGGDSPSVAVTGDGSFVYVAWYDHVNQNLNFGTYGNVTGLALVEVSPTPTAAPTVAPTSAPPSAACEPKGTELRISAQGIAFDTDCLAAPADTPFTIVFDNKDAGIPHNVAVYTDPSAATSLFVGEIITGPAAITYKVGPQKAGTYFFRCDVHPTVMTGTFVVK